MAEFQAVVPVEDLNGTAVLLDPVGDSVAAAPGAGATGERPEQGLADPVRMHRKRGTAQLQPSGGNGFRKPPVNRPPAARCSSRLAGSIGSGVTGTPGAGAGRLLALPQHSPVAG